jgi:hypothetical protein
MARYLIEVPHEANSTACARAVRVFLDTGSHFMTHADLGCPDGEHKAWLTVETDSREEARRILPPPMRARARIIRLTKFSLSHYGTLLQEHLRVAAVPKAERATA